MGIPRPEEQLRELLSSHDTELSYADDIIPRLAAGEYSVSVVEEARFGDLRRTYRVRAGSLTRRERSGELGGTPWVLPTLPAEVRDLSHVLDTAPEQPVRVWDFPLGNGASYVIFELCEERRLAGVLKLQSSPG
jgi:hypothetical protein